MTPSKFPGPKSPLTIIVLITFFILSVCVVQQYDAIRKTVRMRLFAVSSDFTVRKEEINAIANQAKADIEVSKLDSLNAIENKAAALNEAEATREVVPSDVLKAVNKARKETR